ncbi:MAG: ribosomal protein S19 family protein [Candidatus Micrarchaeota archaeon]
MVKKITFHGKTMDEVKAMSFADFIKIIPSHQRRTMLRMSVKFRNFIDSLKLKKAKGKKIVKTHLREMIILPEMLEFEFMVYNGKDWVKVVPQLPMLGHRLGEYAITTKLVKHSGPGIGATRGSKSVELR